MSVRRSSSPRHKNNRTLRLCSTMASSAGYTLSCSVKPIYLVWLSNIYSWTKLLSGSKHTGAHTRWAKRRIKKTKQNTHSYRNRLSSTAAFISVACRDNPIYPTVAGKISSNSWSKLLTIVLLQLWNMLGFSFFFFKKKGLKALLCLSTCYADGSLQAIIRQYIISHH